MEWDEGCVEEATYFFIFKSKGILNYENLEFHQEGLVKSFMLIVVFLLFTLYDGMCVGF